MDLTNSCHLVLNVISQRQSIRAYLDKPISDEQIRQILGAARWAPSGVNTQPWHVAVVRGQMKQTITERLTAARQSERPPEPDYAYYPDEWDEPYANRRVECGRALYAALNIERRDKEAKMRAWYNNYHFFGAPVGMLFFVDKRMNQGTWLDMGMFLQNIMIAAQACGLATCPQASLAEYPALIREILGMEEGYAMICGMSLGYADTDHPINQYRLARAPIEQFTTWYD